ncbi:MAG: hypothetical protein FWG88_03230 [Oscillospiraceae bacterium]|nr:hypothetical protein [Oscillospiraceae bacterium]
MNDRQKAIFDNATELALDGKKDEMEAMLMEHFRMQDEIEKLNEKLAEFMSPANLAKFIEWRITSRGARPGGGSGRSSRSSGERETL